MARGDVAALSVESVSVGSGSEALLIEVNLRLDSGETAALMGPSGCGKSTLLRVLAGIEVPSAGRVVVAGVALDPTNGEARADIRLRSIGVVMQGGSMVDDLTLLENVALPLRFAGVAASSARRSAESLLDEFGIVQLGNRFPLEVSGGERQRAAIARALVGDPALVLADEPTSALDRANVDVAMSLLLDAARRRDAAVVVVSHDPAIAARCDLRWDVVGHSTLAGGVIRAS